MKRSSLKETGPGLYLVPWWNSVDIRPKQALSAVMSTTSSATRRKDDIIALIISSHNQWCGVDYQLLLKKMIDKYQDDRDLARAELEVEAMIRDGLLEVPGYHEWYRRWLNRFYQRIICPTRELLETIVVRMKAREQPREYDSVK